MLAVVAVVLIQELQVRQGLAVQVVAAQVGKVLLDQLEQLIPVVAAGVEELVLVCLALAGIAAPVS
jgi:hypothetical protein